MRVTDSAIYDAALRDTGAARARLEAAQRVSSTGVRVSHPSDDPAAAGQLAALSISTARLDALTQATGRAAGELQAADSAMSAIANALVRAKQLAVQQSNDTYTADQRAAAGLEVSDLIQQVLAAGNAQVAGRYLFGGTSDDRAPFDAAGAYLGSATQRQVEVAPGVMETASIDGNALLRGRSGAATVGVDLLGTLQDLATALATDDRAGVQATLDRLDQATAQVAVARAQGGVSMDAFDTAGTAASEAATQQRKTASDLGDADVVDASIRLAQAQTALQASLASAAAGFKLTLLDYLR